MRYLRRNHTVIADNPEIIHGGIDEFPILLRLIGNSSDLDAIGAS